MLEAAARLSADDFTRDLGASFGSVRGTLLHIMWGEKRYVEFWRTGTRIDDAKIDDYPTVETLGAAWGDVERDCAGFARALSRDALEAQHTVRGRQFRLEDLIQHLVNHSTYHRGQVVLLLRQLGEKPPPTDYALFLIETAASPSGT
jgi:uncharacterized damage-inducible protein DinB